MTRASTAPRVVPEAPAAAGSPEPVVPGRGQPAAAAAGLAFGFGVLLTALASATALVVLARVLESWRVAPGPASHAVSVLGQRLSYPVANSGAIVVTALGGLGLLMVAAAAWRAAHELLAARAFRRTVTARSKRYRDGTFVIEDARPQAFCAGLFRPRVYISSGALELLSEPELAAVLAHERQHARRHDPLRLACGRVLVSGLFFIPSMQRLVERQHALAELSADEAAVQGTGGDRSALAGAMLTFSPTDDAAAPGVDPERIDHLLGERMQWGLPVAVCVGAAVTLTVLIVLALLAGHAAAGSATLAPPFLSSQPCIVILALVPAASALAGWAYVRRGRAPQVREARAGAHD